MSNLDTAVAAAQWWEQLKDTNNDSFLPLFFDKHRFLVLKGGGGSGKSIFAGRKVLERVTTERGHRWLVVRKVAKTLRESCFRQLIGQLNEHYPDCGYRANKSDLLISLDNGSEIIFAGLDDVEKLKSIYNITGIWIEEASEITEQDFNQLDIRLRGKTKYYKQIILTFNPVSMLHWLKKRFFDEPDPRARVHESTYKDNRFLPEEDIRTLEAFKDTDEYYYMVYCLGMWGVTGHTVFDRAAVTRRLQDDLSPKRQGLFEFYDDGLCIHDIRFTDERSGCVKIWREPEKGAPYVIGADTAGDGSDYFVAQVLDNRTGEQAGSLRGKFDEDVFARQLYCLGRYYNDALIGIEANFSTYPIMELERLKYPKQYVRETVDSYTHKTKKSFGFRTDAKTRPVIIANLVKLVRTDTDSIWDETTLQEMLTFVRREKDLRAEAESGANDDCVMSLAIAHYIRPQQDYLSAAPEARQAEWTQDMLEDYEHADAATREYLIRKWGRPF